MAGLFSRITRRAAPPRAPGPERATVPDSPVSAWLERSSEATARPSAPGWGSRNGAPAPPVTPEPAAPPAPAPPVTPEPVAPPAPPPPVTPEPTAPPDRPLAGEIAPAPEPVSRPMSPPAEPEPPTRTLPPVAPDTPTAAESEAPAPRDDADGRPSFRHRARLRRRARYLRRGREVQLRDLGGLVFELDRAGREPGDLVRQKLDALRATSTELTALDGILGDPATLLELREPGVGGSCPHCRAVHGSADAFCASCGQNVAAGRKVNG